MDQGSAELTSTVPSINQGLVIKELTHIHAHTLMKYKSMHFNLAILPCKTSDGEIHKIQQFLWNVSQVGIPPSCNERF
jgi:hypothetical protein